MDSVRQKFFRVRVHFEELDRELEKYYASLPDTVSLAPGSLPGSPLWLSSVDLTVPARIGLIVGDCLQNMRSSLDYLVWELVLANGLTPTRQNAFPIALTEADYKNEVSKRNRLTGISVEAHAVIDALQPYLRAQQHEREGTPLAVLDSLQNINKHRRVLLTGWKAIENFDFVVPRSGKLVHIVPFDPAMSKEERIFTFVGVEDGPIGGMEVTTFVDSFAYYFIETLFPMFDGFFK